MTLSCTRVKGPPFSLEPMRLAGMDRQYSKKAIPQDIRMMRISGHPVEIFISCNLKCPYQAKVINTFDATSISIVQIPCCIDSFFYSNAPRRSICSFVVAQLVANRTTVWVSS